VQEKRKTSKLRKKKEKGYHRSLLSEFGEIVGRQRVAKRRTRRVRPRASEERKREKRGEGAEDTGQKGPEEDRSG